MQAFACDSCNRIMDIQDYRYAKAVSRINEHKCCACLDGIYEKVPFVR